MQAACRVETLIQKLQNAINSYHLGLWPAEIFAVKVEEFSKKLTDEVTNG